MSSCLVPNVVPPLRLCAFQWMVLLGMRLLAFWNIWLGVCLWPGSITIVRFLDSCRLGWHLPWFEQLMFALGGPGLNGDRLDWRMEQQSLLIELMNFLLVYCFVLNCFCCLLRFFFMVFWCQSCLVVVYVYCKIIIIIIQPSTKKNKKCCWNFIMKGRKYDESMR